MMVCWYATLALGMLRGCVYHQRLTKFTVDAII